VYAAFDAALHGFADGPVLPVVMSQNSTASVGLKSASRARTAQEEMAHDVGSFRTERTLQQEVSSPDLVRLAQAITMRALSASARPERTDIGVPFPL